MDSAIKLIQGVAFGQVELIREAHDEGLDLDAELPDFEGRTPMTDAIVERLMQWDERFGIHLVDIRTDGSFTVQFDRLADDLDAFAREIHAFCPDVVDQGFGEMNEAAAQFEASGRGLPDDMRQLLEGLDPGDEDFGLKVLGRWLHTHRAVGFWWD